MLIFHATNPNMPTKVAVIPNASAIVNQSIMIIVLRFCFYFDVQYVHLHNKDYLPI